MKFEDLLNLRVQGLTQAVQAWDDQVHRLDDMREPAERMATRARAANWEGENAEVTVPYVVQQSEQFEAARKEAATFRDLVRDGRNSLRECRESLEDVVQRARSEGLHVSSNGTVSAPDAERETGEDAQVPQERVDGFADEISAILTRAAEIDAQLAQALQDASGTQGFVFNPVEYGSLDEAAEVRRDAERAAEYLLLGEDLTDAQLADVTELLDAHADDPIFAELVATELGARGAMEVWAEVAGSREPQRSPEGRREQEELLAGFQESYGAMLGLATHSNSAEMERWKFEAWSDADQQIANGPTGFQVMSNLMRSGEWDTDFLLDFGTYLTVNERREGDPADQWGIHPSSGYAGYPLNFIGDRDSGGDPMAGFTAALGQNPEASLEFMYRETGEGDDAMTNAQYLREERDWPAERNQNGVLMHVGLENLGQALEAAVSGVPAGSDEPTPPHTERQAELFSDTYAYLASDPDRIKPDGDLAPMAESMGNMTAEYMRDVMRTLNGEVAAGGTSPDDAFPTHGQYADGLWMEIGPSDFRDLIGALALTPEVYGAMVNAQDVVTSEWMAANFPGEQESNAEIAARYAASSASIIGVLEGARVEAAQQQGMSSVEDFNAGVEAGEKWTGRLIGTGLGYLPGPGGEIAQWLAEDIQESVFESFKRSPEEVEEMARGELTNVREDYAQSVRRAIERAGEVAGMEMNEIRRAQADAYREFNQTFEMAAGS